MKRTALHALVIGALTVAVVVGTSHAAWPGHHGSHVVGPAPKN